MSEIDGDDDQTNSVAATFGLVTSSVDDGPEVLRRIGEVMAAPIRCLEREQLQQLRAHRIRRFGKASDARKESRVLA